MRRCPLPHLAAISFAFLLPVLPRALRAQVTLEAGPSVGFFAPTTSFAGQLGSIFPLSRNYKQRIALAVAGEAVLWLSSRVGVGAQVGWSPSDVRQEGESADTSLPASLQWLGGFLALKVTPRHLTNDLRLRAGVGYLRHRGGAFALYNFPSSTTALLGIETTFPLGRRVRIAAGLDAYVYSLQLTDTLGTRYEKRAQTDLLGRVGLHWLLGHRARKAGV